MKCPHCGKQILSKQAGITKLGRPLTTAERSKAYRERKKLEKARK